MREFEQMEMQFFVDPGTEESGSMHWSETALELVSDRRHEPLHTSCGTSTAKTSWPTTPRAAVDIYYQFPFGWKEMEGIHDRTDSICADTPNSAARTSLLRRGHRAHPSRTSSRPRSARIARRWRSFATPTTRTIEGGDKRVVLRLHKRLAPIKVAVMPLSKKEPFVALAH